MPKFLFLYEGPPSNMTEQETQNVMDEWSEWIDKVGDALVDVGTPLDPDGLAMVDDETSHGDVSMLNGYSIVEAEDMESAKQLTQGHPYLSDGNGDYSVNIYQLQELPDMP